MTDPQHRILVVAPFAPSLDARHGAARALGGLVGAFARRLPTAVVHVRAHDDDVIDEALRSRLDAVRSVDLPQRRSRLGQLAAVLGDRPLWVQAWWGSELIAALDEMLDDWRPDVVHVELDVMAPAVDQIARRGVPSVFTVHEPARAMASPPSRWPLLDMLDRRAWRRTEAKAVTQASATVVFTERDAHFLAGEPRRVDVIPLGAGVPPSRTRPADTLRDGQPVVRPRVVFVGGGIHPPNLDAVDRIVQSILPRLVATRDDITVALIGDRNGREEPTCPCPDQACTHLVVLGDVDDVTPHLEDATVVVAPLRLGGGMRVKVLDALAAGAAVVASSLALAGLDDVVAAGAARRADTDAEIVSAIHRLVDDTAARTHLKCAARCWASTCASWDARVDDLLALHRQIVLRSDCRTVPV